MSPADSLSAQLPAPGPHPATAELRAYAAGTLTPTEQHRVEAHTLDCERCADLVEGFSMSDAATTDQVVASLRTRLQARTGPTAKPASSGWAWPRVAAAAALLGVVAGGIWSWEKHAQTTIATTARLETPQSATSAPSVPQAQPILASPSQPRIAVAPVPEATGATDYAAVQSAPAPRPTSRAPRRSVLHPADALAKGVVAAQSETTNHSINTQESSAANDAILAQSPASAARVAASMAAAPPAPKIGYVLEEKTAANDMVSYAKRTTMARASTAAVAPGTAADNTAPARVTATPMPAAPAVNPAPVGGSLALREYLRREATGFDPEINALRMTGTVRVQFVVGADGRLSNLKVTRGLRADYDAEAVRIVCEGPAWQPGIAGGRRAPLVMEVTVPF